jgi:hypothetical protein
MFHPILRLAPALCLVLAACGSPPVYVLKSSEPVTVDGQICTAELYDVTYSRLFQIGRPEAVVTRDEGTEYRIICGGAITSCGIDQGLGDCVAALERRRDSSGGGYRPPG